MFWNKRGYTLVELLAILAIIALLMTAVFSIFIFSQRLFLSTSRRNSLHNSLRVTAEHISNELRFAFFLELVNEPDWDVDAVDVTEYSYIYFDRDSNSVILLNEDGSKVLSDGKITDTAFYGNVSTLLFNLEGEKGKESYTLESSVRLLNYRCNFQNPDSPIALRFSMDPNIIIP
jgi:prepilin-type N-terminal cleavage/methylation domain-containing protein